MADFSVDVSSCRSQPHANMRSKKPSGARYSSLPMVLAGRLSAVLTAAILRRRCGAFGLIKIGLGV